MANPVGEEMVPSTSTVFGDNDDKGQAAGAAGPMDASRSQPNIQEASDASLVTPIPTLTLSLDQMLKLNALTEMIWEFHDWLRSLQGQETLTPEQGAELARRIGAANQWLTDYKELIGKLLELRHEDSEKRFFGVYLPVMNRATRLLKSPSAVSEPYFGPSTSRSDVEQPPPPKTSIDTKLFVDHCKALEDKKHDRGALEELWENVMSRMSDVRYVHGTKGFRDTFFRLEKSPALGKASVRKFFDDFYHSLEAFKRRFVEFLDMGDFAAPDECVEV